MDMGALLKQAKKMQKDLAKTEAELKEKLYTASVGGGVVKVEVSGKNEFTNIQIEESLLNKENKEELQDMILMAVNDALRQMNEDKEKTMGALTSGIKIPGVF